MFRDAATFGQLEKVIKLFLNKGYLISAKHNFQLLKEIKVGDQRLIFNVDLLHPSESQNKPEMFVDHLTLDIPLKEYQSDKFMLKSIVLLDSAVLFDGYFIQHYCAKIDKSFPLMNEVGCLITKSSSVLNKKRQRDAFDIFLALNKCRDYSNLIENLIKLKKEDRRIYNSLYSIRQAFEQGVIVDNVLKFQNIDYDIIKNTFDKFINDSELYQKAENL